MDRRGAQARFKKAQKLMRKGDTRDLSADQQREIVQNLTYAVENGHADACCYLGQLYDEGECGLDRDSAKAVELYDLGMKRGDECALGALAYMYEHGKGGLKKCVIEAFILYEKAALAGDGSAQNNLGRCYMEGLGCERDVKKAFEWYKKATYNTSSGMPQAKINLAGMYLSGQGVRRQLKKGKKLLRQVRDSKGASSAEAALRLAEVYMEEGGIKNFERARSNFEFAAKNGNAEGMCMYGDCLEKGVGGEANAEQAQIWYRKAADAGYNDAKDALTRLKEEKREREEARKPRKQLDIRDFFPPVRQTSKRKEEKRIEPKAKRAKTAIGERNTSVVQEYEGTQENPIVVQN
uniref:Uncharacterized protein n=1 Tax=Palpitomonas bilix TaxID=652834 RepID=A0A7S3D005_9EUKA